MNICDAEVWKSSKRSPEMKKKYSTVMILLVEPLKFQEETMLLKGENRWNLSQTFSWISLWRWIPQDSIAANKVNMYCWTLQMAGARELIIAVSPTFSIILWNAAGEWRVILHKACRNKRADLSDNSKYIHMSCKDSTYFYKMERCLPTIGIFQTTRK